MEVAARRISLLVAWRRGAAAAALCSGGVLASGLLGPAAPLAGIGIAVGITAGVDIALRSFLRKCALCRELTEIPAVARYRDRLCSVRRRRQLATWLRRIASASPRAQSSPLVLWGRVALVRDELVVLADELESADTVDPRTMVELHELLSSGRDSPMLNDQLPASELSTAILRARFRLVTAPLQRTIHESAVASDAAFAAPGRDRRAADGRPSADARDEDALRRTRQADDR